MKHCPRLGCGDGRNVVDDSTNWAVNRYTKLSSPQHIYLFYDAFVICEMSFSFSLTEVINSFGFWVIYWPSRAEKDKQRNLNCIEMRTKSTNTACGIGWEVVTYCLFHCSRIWQSPHCYCYCGKSGLVVRWKRKEGEGCPRRMTLEQKTESHL